MSDGKDVDLPVLVKLRVGERGLPYEHEKIVEIELADWNALDAEGRREHLDELRAEYAAEIFETDWKIWSDHDLDAPGPES